MRHLFTYSCYVQPAFGTPAMQDFSASRELWFSAINPPAPGPSTALNVTYLPGSGAWRRDDGVPWDQNLLSGDVQAGGKITRRSGRKLSNTNVRFPVAAKFRRKDLYSHPPHGRLNGSIAIIDHHHHMPTRKRTIASVCVLA